MPNDSVLNVFLYKTFYTVHYLSSINAIRLLKVKRKQVNNKIPERVYKQIVKSARYLDVVPLVVVHRINVDAQLRSREAHARHLVLQAFNSESSRDYVVQEQLKI